MNLHRFSAVTFLVLSAPCLHLACSEEGDSDETTNTGGDGALGGATSSGGSSSSGGSASDTGGADPGTGGGAPGTGGGTAGEPHVPGTDDYDCSAAEGEPSQLQLIEYASGFTVPVLASHAPNDARVFVAELGGVIKVVKDGVTNPSAFLDIRDRVRAQPDSDAGSEQGLLGLAFHPDYSENGLFYVHYSASGADTDYENGDTVIAEYQVSDDGDVADASSERVVLDVTQPAPNHNGGTIAFGPDGHLYIALGDGGGSGDEHKNGQVESTLLGSILRIDPLESGDDYTVPEGNLSEVLPTAAPELWDMGLRNPYRMNFDACTGDLYIGDVGQNLYEEVNVEPAGEGHKNYGWNTMEGLHCFNPTTGCDQTGLALPVLEYPRGDSGAVIGGAVYRGSTLPWLRGTYFYADNIKNTIWSFVYNEKTGQISNEQNHTADLSPTAITAIQNDSQGELLFVQGTGTILKLATP